MAAGIDPGVFAREISCPWDMNHPCPPSKILNPVTGRCVAMDGAIGQVLLYYRNHVRVKVENQRNQRNVRVKVENQRNVKRVKSVNTNDPYHYNAHCPVSNASKYHTATRASPPRPANDSGCRDRTFRGNDGRLYLSVPNKNGVYRWVLA